MKFVRVIPVNERLQICTRDKVGTSIGCGCVVRCVAGGSQLVRHVPHTEYTAQKSIPTQDLQCDRTDVSVIISAVQLSCCSFSTMAIIETILKAKTTKVLWYNFLSKCRENFHFFAFRFSITNYLYIILKKCHNPKISRKNFHVLSKICFQKFCTMELLLFTVFLLLPWGVGYLNSS